jgi:hypothetical protein
MAAEILRNRRQVRCTGGKLKVAGSPRVAALAWLRLGPRLLVLSRVMYSWADGGEGGIVEVGV